MAESEQKMRQLSAKQKETLVNFVYARQEMQKGKFTPTYTKVVANALWEQVTASLNSIPGGSIKTPIQWNKTWRDLRKNVKKKVSKELKYTQGTGGGPPMPPPALPESDITIDEKIIEILTPVAVEGNKKVPDPFVIAEDIMKTTNDLDHTDYGNEDINIFNIINDEYASSSGIQIKGKHIQPDDLPTEPEVKFTQTNKENAKPETNSNIQKKRYTKSSRLSDSLKNNKKFLTISEQGMSSTDRYREKKLQMLQNHYDKKHEYLQEQLKIFNNISETLVVIAEGLQ